MVRVTGEADPKEGHNIAESLGSFGDFFGGVVNPIVTFLAFFGLILTIVIQRIELRQSRHEFKKTASALTVQSIETTFFNLIDLHHKIVDDLSFNAKQIPRHGEYLNHIDYLGGITKVVGLGHVPPEFNLKTKVGRAVFAEVVMHITFHVSGPLETLERYKILQNKHNYVLGHYFRNLYQALKLIDQCPVDDVPDAQKFKYASILRAQLSANELIALFFNCLDGVVDNGEFKKLLILYRFLEHIPLEYKGGKYYDRGSGAEIADDGLVAQYFGEGNLETGLHKEISCGAFGKNPTFVARVLSVKVGKEALRASAKSERCLAE